MTRSKEAIEEFHVTHHTRVSQAVVDGLVWVNNLTDEPCTNNPCSVCIRMNNLGVTIEV